MPKKEVEYNEKIIFCGSRYSGGKLSYAYKFINPDIKKFSRIGDNNDPDTLSYSKKLSVVQVVGTVLDVFVERNGTVTTVGSRKLSKSVLSEFFSPETEKQLVQEWSMLQAGALEEKKVGSAVKKGHPEAIENKLKELQRMTRYLPTRQRHAFALKVYDMLW